MTCSLKCIGITEIYRPLEAGRPAPSCGICTHRITGQLPKNRLTEVYRPFEVGRPAPGSSQLYPLLTVYV